MIILKTPEALQQYCLNGLNDRLSIGLVMTMGNLHEGHASLVQRSLQENTITVVSIFVNPTQFNQSSDYENYPRTIEEDIRLLDALGVSAVFVPEESAMYPDNAHYCVDESVLSHQMEGHYRPGHFKGVLTIVMKVLLLSRATRAYFSEKDYQQLELVQGMVDAFFLETQIVACPFLRDKKGLALSSRNSRLTASERQLAYQFVTCLQESTTALSAQKNLEQLGIQVDYVTDWQGRRFAAVWIGAVRLIDNIPIQDQPILMQ